MTRRVRVHQSRLLADRLTPVEAYHRLRSGSGSGFLFESVAGGEQVARYSLLATRPRELYHLHADRLERHRDGAVERLPGAPLEALRALLGGYRSESCDLPFAGGFVGYFGFDLVRLAEELPPSAGDAFGLPVAILGRFDSVLVFDHARQQLVAAACEIEDEVDRSAATAELERLTRLVSEPRPLPGATGLPAETAPLEAECLFPGPEFRRAVEVVREHIAAGDAYQVVLARRWRLPRRPSPLALYRALRTVNPSPYMLLLETPQVSLAGASPEMLLRIHAERVETRPIAGTRPRGGDPDADRRLARELLEDPKERAEHLMLVDLGRNDLGRIAAAGTVRVPEFLEVERYSHVMHLVSSVEAHLAPGTDGLDALLACFPAGTVSGAPKLEAIRILSRLEPEGRGPYAGAVGYLSYGGDLDTCIAIRTLISTDRELSVTAGAGIVADSDPAREERETESKAAALLAAVALAESVEPEP